MSRNPNEQGYGKVKKTNNAETAIIKINQVWCVKWYNIPR